ncbi:hypothetical protein ACFFOP_24285 [Sinosporangium siamense]
MPTMTNAFEAQRNIALVLSAVLLTAACGRQAHWYAIESATVARDGRTVTATILTSPPAPDGTSCEEVTQVATAEHDDRVLVGIEVRDNCEPLFPWEDARMTPAIGYPMKKQLLLEKPLAGRRLIDQATDQEIPIMQ